jgi:hypothetical protein
LLIYSDCAGAVLQLIDPKRNEEEITRLPGGVGERPARCWLRARYAAAAAAAAARCAALLCCVKFYTALTY